MRVTSDIAYGWRIMVWCGFLALGITLCTGHAPIWRVGVGVLVIGLTIVHGVQLQHQALHNTGFRSRRANEFWGVVLGIPALVSFYEYRVAHLFHHAKLGKPEHQDLYNLVQDGKPSKAQGFLLAHYVRTFLPHLCRVLRSRPLEHHVYRYSRVQQRQFKRFYVVGGGFILVLAALGLVLETWLPLATWLLALLLVAVPIHAVFEFPEHVGCDVSLTDVTKNTRSIRSNVFMRWLTHYNNLHAEHHLEPKTPFHLLPTIHTKISMALEESRSGYIDFYIDYLRRVHPTIRRHEREELRQK